jgi:hypothetical protein
MRRLLTATALAALLLAGSLTPAFARSSSHSAQPQHSGAMCVRGAEGACNPGLQGWGHDRRWSCHPVMGPQPPGYLRSHAWVCGWTTVRHGRG